jgi:hypothetical protein
MELTIEKKEVSIDDILREIVTEGTIWDEIIENIIHPNSHLKPELISEISLGYLENKEKIEDVWEKGYFKYYFINTVRNQIRSNTSSFHKNIRITDYKTFDEGLDIMDESTDDDILHKIEKETKIGTVKNILNRLPISWFEHQMFIEYYFNNRTYRNIEEEYTLDHVLVWKTVKKVREMVITEIKNNKK